MTLEVLGTYRVGATLNGAIDLVDSENTGITVRAVMKRIRIKSDDTWFFWPDEEGVELVVEARAHHGQIPNGWNFSLGATETAALTPGHYAIDAEFTLPNSVVVSEVSAVIEMTQGAVP